MQSFTQKQSPPLPQVASAAARPVEKVPSRRPDVIRNLQRSIGNQAVLRLLRSQAPAGMDSAGETRTPATAAGSNLSAIPARPTPRLALQTKLTVNTPGDAYEQEADRIAEQVTRMPEPQVQRTCACGGTCNDCKRRPDSPQLQMKSVSGSDVGQKEAPPSVHEVLRSPGQPLDAATRAFMEQRLGHDFGSVQLHTDSKASDSAKEINARAYTAGRDIVFANIELSSATGESTKLLAHELVHVVQQGKGATTIQRAPKTDRDDPVAPSIPTPIKDPYQSFYRDQRGPDGGAFEDEYTSAMIREKQKEQEEKEAKERKASEDRYDSLRRIREVITTHTALSDWQITDLIARRVDNVGWAMLNRYGCDLRHQTSSARSHTSDAYRPFRDCIVNAIVQYEDAAKNLGPVNARETKPGQGIADEERRKRIREANAEGLAGSEESLLGAAFGYVWGLFDDDPVKKTAAIEAGGGAGNFLMPLGEAALAAKEKSAPSPIGEIDPIVETHVPEPPIQTPDPIRPGSPAPVLDFPTLTKDPAVTAADLVNSAKASASRTMTDPPLQEHTVLDPTDAPIVTTQETAAPPKAKLAGVKPSTTPPHDPQVGASPRVPAAKIADGAGSKASVPTAQNFAQELVAAQTKEAGLVQQKAKLEKAVEDTGHEIGRLENQLEYIKDQAPDKRLQPGVEDQLELARKREKIEKQRVTDSATEIAKTKAEVQRLGDQLAVARGWSSRAPQIAMGDVKSIYSYRKGIRHVSEMEGRGKYNTDGNIGIALYDSQNGNVILQVYGPALPGQARKIIFEEPIGRIDIPKGRTPIQIGNDVEEPVRDLVRKATGQNFPAKPSNWHGPDLVTPPPTKK